MDLKKLCRVSLFCFILVGAFNTWSIEAPDYQIKAAYLYNFCRFTEWPVSASPQPLYVCVAGNDPFNGSFDRLVEGKSINNRPIKVRHIENLRDFNQCNIFYLSSTDAKGISVETLRSSLTQGTLSVGDAPDFISEGGQVRLFEDRGKVAFEINLGAVERAGLKIDARVLSLAKKIWH